MEEKNRFSYYTFDEGMSGIGQHVRFSCHPDARDQVKEFLRTTIRSIERPVTGRVKTVEHGSYGRYTRYDIHQHAYAGGEGGFIEVLEIKDPPEGRCGCVLHEYDTVSGSAFTEWESLEQARLAYDKRCWGIDAAKESAKLPGFVRHVPCGDLMPWFYAVGEELLIGDYALPRDLQDDAVFRIGRKFVVMEDSETPVIKTCMGTRFVKEKDDGFIDRRRNRLVYWNDGSVWDEYLHHHDALPRPLEENEMWIAEAMQQFKKLLTGKSTEFSINFADGSKFVGKVMQTKPRQPCAEGRYFVIATLKNGKTINGWVDFKPTTDAPDVVQFTMQGLAKTGQEAERIDIKECQPTTSGKKWAGAFFLRSR